MFNVQTVLRMAKKSKIVPETPEQFALNHVKCAGCGEWCHIHEAWLNKDNKEQYHYLCLPNEYREKLKKGVYNAEAK